MDINTTETLDRCAVMIPLSINYGDDLLDVRDLIERYEELESREMSQDFDDEYNLLKKLLEELKGNGGDEQWKGDWYPAALIRGSYFEETMDQMLEECGYLQPYEDRPCFIKIEIDYDALQMDYTSVDIDGVDYWYR